MVLSQRRILVLDDHNWAGVRWDRVLLAKWQLRCLFGYVPISLEELAAYAANSDAEVREAMAGLAPGVCGEVVFRGFRLWEMAKTGICASLERPVCAAQLGSERELRVVRHYYEFVCRMVLACERALDELRPNTVIVSQGASPMTRPLVEVARRRGMNVVATENSFAGGHFFCDNATGIILNRHGAALLDGAWLEAMAFGKRQMADFDAFLAAAKSRKQAEHDTGKGGVQASVREQLGIPPDQRLAVFVGQVCTDASIVMDSRLFVDPVDLIERVCAFFRGRPDWTLVVRLHPKEWKGTSWANAEGLPGPPPGEPCGPLPYNSLTARRLQERGLADVPGGRLRVVPDLSVDTQRLMGEADVGITMNSQAGFEMALMDRPVVVCADAFYGRKGFTFDVAHPAALESTLMAACENGPLNEQAARRARQFGAWLFQSVLFPRDLHHRWQRLFQVIAPDLRHGMERRLLEGACRRMQGSSAGDDWYAPSR